MDVRGDGLARRVGSWFGRSARGETKSVSTVEDTTTEGIKRTTSTEITDGAVEANVLTIRRGDALRLALLLRDGREVLDAADGMANVGLTIRRPNAADGDYLFDLTGVATTLGDHEYFLATLVAAGDALDELMSRDGVAGASGPAITALGELRCTLGGVPISSSPFPVSFVEDVRR